MESSVLEADDNKGFIIFSFHYLTHVCRPRKVSFHSHVLLDSRVNVGLLKWIHALCCGLWLFIIINSAFTQARPAKHHSGQGSQTGVHVPLEVHLPSWRGTFKVSNRRGKMGLYFIHFEMFIHTVYQWMLFSNIIIGLLVNIFLLFFRFLSYEFFVIFKRFLIRNFRGECSSVKTLKGYMVRVSMGTPVPRRRKVNDLSHVTELANRISWNRDSSALVYISEIRWPGRVQQGCPDPLVFRSQIRIWVNLLCFLNKEQNEFWRSLIVWRWRTRKAKKQITGYSFYTFFHILSWLKLLLVISLKQNTWQWAWPFLSWKKREQRSNSLSYKQEHEWHTV